MSEVSLFFEYKNLSSDAVWLTCLHVRSTRPSGLVVQFYRKKETVLH